MHYNMLTASSNPQFALQVNNCYQIIIGSAALFPLFQYQFLEIFQFPLSAAFSHQFHSKFHPVFYSLIPPLAFPLTTVPCRVPPSPGWIVPALSVWALPHMRTEWTSDQPVFNARTINTQQGDAVINLQSDLRLTQSMSRFIKDTHTSFMFTSIISRTRIMIPLSTIVFLSCVSTPTRY